MPFYCVCCFDNFDCFCSCSCNSVRMSLNSIKGNLLTYLYSAVTIVASMFTFILIVSSCLQVKLYIVAGRVFPRVRDHRWSVWHHSSWNGRLICKCNPMRGRVRGTLRKSFRTALRSLRPTGVGRETILVFPDVLSNRLVTCDSR